MSKTLGEQLSAVQNAIEAVLTSQSYKLGGREMTRADLEVLYAREDRLEAKIEKYGCDYIPGQNKTPRRRLNIRYGVFRG